MTNPRGNTLPKGDIVVYDNFFIFTVDKVALLGIPEVRPNVIGHVASLYVDNLFHDFHTESLTSVSVFNKDVD